MSLWQFGPWCKHDYMLLIEYLEQLSAQGAEFLPELIRILEIAAMQIERQGHANAYKAKTVQTRVGDITFAIPQVREGGFYPGGLGWF